MGKIILKGLEFFAHHGFYEEERKIGNKYSIDIEVSTDFKRASTEDDLTGTINYEVLYEIINDIMKTPTKLLETIGKKIIQEVRLRLGSELDVLVSVSKFNPPIGGICERATVVISSEE